MIKKEKVITQIIICAMIFTAVKVSDYVSGQWIDPIKNTIKEKATENNTIDDISRKGEKIIDTLLEVPSIMTSTIEKANNVQKVSAPIDQNNNENVKSVYAVEGGVVSAVGIDKDKNYFVTIEHDDKITSYRNMSGITVVTKDRVRIGKMIGTYDSNCGKKFEFEEVEKKTL